MKKVRNHTYAQCVSICIVAKYIIPITIPVPIQRGNGVRGLYVHRRLHNAQRSLDIIRVKYIAIPPP